MIKLPFRDRFDAGRLLGAELATHNFNFRKNTIVLGLAPGGVAVASAVATVLRAPLDVLVVCKFGVPSHPELTIGSIAGGRIRILDERVIEEFCIPTAEVEGAVAKEMEEVERRERLYRDERPAPELHEWTVVLVDEDLATCSTMLPALQYIDSFRPAAVIVAAPVGSADACQEVRTFADDCVCLASPEPFSAAAAWYSHFDQVSDTEIRRLLQQNRQKIGPPVKTITLQPEMMSNAEAHCRPATGSASKSLGSSCFCLARAAGSGQGKT